MATTTLFVNQLPFGATQRDVAAFFAQAEGAPAVDELMPSVRLVHKDGKFAGTAFVDMRDWASADAAIALHQAKFRCADGSARRVNVREAMSKEQLAKLGETGRARDKATPQKARKGKKYAGEGAVEESTGDGVTGALGTDRRGRTIVGELDPQRKRKQLESEYLKKRRELQDMQCTCRDCNAPFIFSVFEQEFFLAKDWAIPRQRCKACSTAKKAKPRGGGDKGTGDKGTSEKLTSTPPASRKSSGSDDDGNGARAGGSFRCHACGQAGHTRAECPKLGREMVGDKGGDGSAKRVVQRGGTGAGGGRKEQSAAAVTCFICGQTGHFAKNCALKTNDHEVGRAMKAAAKAAGKKRKPEDACGPDGVGEATSTMKKSGFHRGRKEARRR